MKNHIIISNNIKKKQINAFNLVTKEKLKFLKTEKKRT